MKILITGASGFIGMHLCSKLMLGGHRVIGLDDQTYTGPVLGGLLRERRTFENLKHRGMKYHDVSLMNVDKLTDLLKTERVDQVIHLGVSRRRYDFLYYSSNVQSFENLLKACKNVGIQKVIYASTSTFECKDQNVIVKEKFEQIAQASGIPAIGLKYFSVYGPWGRPDMFVWVATDHIVKESPLNVDLHSSRDFIHINDVIDVTERVIKTDYKESTTIQVGTGISTPLITVVNLLEQIIGKSAHVEQIVTCTPRVTLADTKAISELGKTEFISLQSGLNYWFEWYQEINS